MKKLLWMLSLNAALSPAIFAQEIVNPIPKSEQSWTYAITPYVWAAGVNTSVRTPFGTLDPKESASNAITQLSGAAMLSAEAHYDKFGLMGDLFYVQFKNRPFQLQDRVPLGTTNFSFKQTIFSGAATYTLLRNDQFYLDGLAGVRVVSMTADADLLQGSRMSANYAHTTNAVDPIIGIKGRMRISDSEWFVPFYGDIGGGFGETNFTWQGQLGIGKAFSWGDISLGYRALQYTMKRDIVKSTMSGAIAGVSFRF